jgi:hypothetical protein
MRKPRISYANVVSTMALCLALGGVSYAAVKLPKNSVVSATIKNGQVKNKDLGKNAVTDAKIKDGINGSKLADGSLANGKLAGGIDGAKLSDGSIAAGKLAAGVTTPADGSISSAKIADGAVGFNDLSSDVQSRAEGAYASIDGYGPTIQGAYHKNVLNVTRVVGQPAGQYCVTIDWAAAGRTPASQATPVFAMARDSSGSAAADVYACPDNGVIVTLRNSGGSLADGWVHILVP